MSASGMVFSEPSKRVISVLSSGRCSNPSCRISMLEDYKLIGKFCHIEGEKEKSARYNRDQTEIERDRPQNGILLCSNCHTLIDGDPVKYTTEMLHDWKESDQKSPKLQDWLDKRIPFMSVISSLQENLPIAPTSYFGEKSLFLGRDLEITKIIDLISAGNKVISVVGEGGIGKSSLTIKAIRQMESLFDIIIPVSLTPNMTFHNFLLESVKIMNSAFLNNLETNDLESFIREIFGSVGKILFFVDSYENIADFIDTNPNENMKKIHSFLESLPSNVSIVLNSRNRSNLAGETTITVKGLSSDFAVDLFIQMARNYFPDPIPQQARSRITEICKMVEGHPLAIKLLGGAYKGGGVRRLNEMYGELFSSIQSMREYAERHRSIAACFNYSYQRLTPKLQKYLFRLTSFKTFFIGDAAMEVFGIQETVLTDFFQRTLLRRSSILGKAGQENLVYDFHPLIKSFLIRKNSASFTFTPYELRRYIKFHSNFIRKIYDSFYDDVPGISKLIELMTGGTTTDFWESVNGIEDERERSVISNLLGLLLLQTGHKGIALRYHELCYRIDSRHGDLDRIANDLTNIGACISEYVYSESALSIRNKLAKDFENKGKYKQAGRQYLSVASYYSIKGDYESSEANCKKGISNFRKQTGTEMHIADSLQNITLPLLKNEKYQEAIDCAKESVDMYEKLGHKWSEAGARSNLSKCYLKRNAPGDLNLALKAIEKATKIDLDEKNIRGLIRDYRVTSEVYQLMNDPDQASHFEDLAKDAVTQFEKETNEPFTDRRFTDYLEFSDT